MTYEQQIINDITVTLEALQVQPILFVGSGMSQRYFDAPNWKGLMELLAEKCPKIPKKFAYYEQQFQTENGVDYMAMASSFIEPYSEWAWEDDTNEYFPKELFESGINKEEYIKHIVSKIIEDISTKAILEKSPLYEEIKLLQQIKPHAIITTNYDSVLEKIFPDYLKVIGEKIIHANYTTYGEILKIHGCYEDRNSLILTQNDYKDFNLRKKYLSAKLLTYFAEHPLFFIGYSCNDPNIISILADIDEILCPNGELVPNIYLVVYEPEFKEGKSYQTEVLIPINTAKSIRIKVIYAKDYKWILSAISKCSPSISVNPKLLRALLDRTYKLVSSDIPKRELPFNFEILQNIESDDESLPKLFGLTSLNDGQTLNANYPYTLTQVAKKLKLKSWHKVDKILDEIWESYQVSIRATDNIYHVAIKTGSKSVSHKYSDNFIALMQDHIAGIPYQINI
ncbi:MULTISPECIES: SIR2 family protein [Acinetobacter]|uniref:SIR2 family protein n=1 Tax=Acinetobacter TaxID=469 RepID=UPI00258DEC28|nr:SIR2 family protein [Acinetobacter sp.]